MYRSPARYDNERGFTVIEVMVVATVMAIILAIGASSLSGMSVLRYSVDETTNNIASLLQLGKLQSVRDGVEYRLVFAECGNINESEPECPRCTSNASYTAYAPGDESLAFTLERGDSNRGSEVWCIQSSYTRKFRSDLNLISSANMTEDGAPLNFTFVPNGMRRDFLDDVEDEVITIRPTNDSKIDKCGRITVTPMGGINVVEGKWIGSQCNPIRDAAASPTPGPG